MKSIVLSLAAILMTSTGFSQGNQQNIGLTVYKSEFSDNHSHSPPQQTRVAPDGKIQISSEQPGIKAYQIKTGLEYERKIEQGTVTVQIIFPTWDISSGYHWGTTVESILVSTYLDNGDHKYFWFHKGGKTLQIEYPAPGLNKYSKYIFPSVLRGNDLDMSQAVNGHMPSKISQKELFGPDTLWIHSSGNGNEAYKIVEMPDVLQQFNNASAVLKFMDERFRNADKMDLLEISKKANDPEVLKQIGTMVEWAINTDLFGSPIYIAYTENQRELDELFQKKRNERK